MKALFIDPQFPYPYWSFKHALSFPGERAAQPSLELIAAAATRYRHACGIAMTLVVMGYHLRVVTHRPPADLSNRRTS